jgi:hypothetical protein
VSETQKDDERASGEHELEVKKPGSSRGPWDPFSYLRKTISPAQRLELLRLEVPILPPEDFMDTADFRRARRARLRRWWPALLGFGALMLALMFAGLWLRRSPPVIQPSSSAVALPMPLQTPGQTSSPPRPLAGSTLPPIAPAPVVTSNSSATLNPAPAGEPSASPKPLRVEHGTPSASEAAVHSAPHANPVSSPSPSPPIDTSAPAPSGKTFWTTPR